MNMFGINIMILYLYSLNVFYLIMNQIGFVRFHVHVVATRHAIVLSTLYGLFIITFGFFYSLSIQLISSSTVVLLFNSVTELILHFVVFSPIIVRE